jgi:gamma-glutamyltranspeptidase/glutathione hydrolase/leukotriene-C4 hydrolase
VIIRVKYGTEHSVNKFVSVFANTQYTNCFSFGAGVTSHTTGIILNSGMNDFSIPKTKSYFGIPFSPANAIAPGKRAVSSMCPSVIVNGEGDVRLVIGASGGTKITTAVAYVRISDSFTGLKTYKAKA